MRGGGQHVICIIFVTEKRKHDVSSKHRRFSYEYLLQSSSSHCLNYSAYETCFSVDNAN